MQIEILGSGGAFPTPRPGCHCRVCDEARDKGVPYARSGPATFIHGANILFDTPEEIRDQLNRSGIDRVAACFYSHWHPDHVMGRRVFEPLNWDIREWPWRPRITGVYLPAQVAVDFRTRLGTAEHLAYLEDVGVVRVHEVADGDSVAIGEVTVTPMRLPRSFVVYAFLVEEGDTRVVITPDHAGGWTPPESLTGVDLIVLPMGLLEHDPLTRECRFPAGHPFLQEATHMSQSLELVRSLRPKRAILSHVEEEDDLGPDRFAELAARYQRDGLPITFAHDTMRVTI